MLAPRVSVVQSEAPAALSTAPSLSLSNKKLVVQRESIRHGVFNGNKKTRWTSIGVVRAVKEEEFEVDPEKAREALKNLDRQFQSLTQKQTRLRPKNQPAPPPVNFTRNQTKESAEEFSGDFFTYTAIALLCFTVVYNVFFYTVIKPSVDGVSEDVPTTSVETKISK